MHCTPSWIRAFLLLFALGWLGGTLSVLCGASDAAIGTTSATEPTVYAPSLHPVVIALLELLITLLGLTALDTSRPDRTT
jgi:hypothetical protein